MSVEADQRVVVDRCVVAVAAELNARLGEVSSTIRTVLARDITELSGDQRLVELLGASIEGNVDTILHILQHNIAARNVEPPSAAVEYARRLAQRGVPINALVRAYRLGQDHLLKWSFAEIARQDPDPAVAFRASQRIVEVTFSYIDWMSQRVVTVYEAEREQWLQNRHTVRAARIRELVEGADLDLVTAEAALGYPLRQHHLGAILWQDADTAPEDELANLERFVGVLARRLGCPGRPLFAACDRTSAWAWLPRGRQSDPVEPDVVHRLVAETPDAPRIALGTAVAGIVGFRETHRQARAAQRVALVAGVEASAVTSYGIAGVRAAALLCADLDETRVLVRTALGPLATDDPTRARLRETLLTFLSTSSSYTATAELLSMHKNSVKYRVAKAQDERGAPIGDDRLDVELALIACRYLGAAVLSPA